MTTNFDLFQYIVEMIQIKNNSIETQSIFGSSYYNDFDKINCVKLNLSMSNVTHKSNIVFAKFMIYKSPFFKE